MSRSKTSRSDFDQSAVGMAMSSAPPNGSSAPPSPPKPPNRSNCPSASLRLRLIADVDGVGVHGDEALPGVAERVEGAGLGTATR